jgi:ABC-type phosphate transport system substrate-binding protein
VVETQAKLTATVNPYGFPTKYVVEYGKTQNPEHTTTATLVNGTGTSPMPVTTTLTGLSPDTTYYYRLKAFHFGDDPEPECETSCDVGYGSVQKFTTNGHGQACSGISVTGQRASVEAIALQSVWGPGFNTSSNAAACSGTQGSGGKPAVTYSSTSSGAGLESWGMNKHAASFGGANAFIGTTEPPSESQIAEVEHNETTITPNTVESIPVAQVAIAIVVNLPEHCVATSTDASGRLVLTDSTLQGIFLGTIHSWSEITEGGDKLSGTGCNTASPITRVVRQDQAGTTHILKRYLGLIDSGSLETESGTKATWDEIAEGTLNTKWPKGAIAVVRPAKQGDGEEAAKVASTPGSIGYADLAEVRNAALFSGAGGGPGTARFWVELQREEKVSETKVTYVYADPSTNKDVEAAKNANCKDTVYMYYANGAPEEFPPPSVESAWNEVSAELTSKTYPLCGLAYILAFKSYAAYPGTELREATTAENFLRFVLEASGGQKLIEDHDYLGLTPKSILLDEAQTGAKTVEF